LAPAKREGTFSPASDHRALANYGKTSTALELAAPAKARPEMSAHVNDLRRRVAFAAHATDVDLPAEIALQRQRIRDGHFTLDEFAQLSEESFWRLLGVPRVEVTASRGTAGDLFPALPRERPRDVGVAMPMTSNKDMLHRAITTLKIGEDDVVYDLGSGTGSAVLAFRALTHAKAVKGVELEPADAAYTEHRAQQLNLPVEILNQDFRKADLSDGTVFYCFNPSFRASSGAVSGSSGGLRAQQPEAAEVADKLLALGLRKTIRILATGPIFDFLRQAADEGRMRFVPAREAGPGYFESIPRETIPFRFRRDNGALSDLHWVMHDPGRPAYVTNQVGERVSLPKGLSRGRVYPMTNWVQQDLERFEKLLPDSIHSPTTTGPAPAGSKSVPSAPPKTPAAPELAQRVRRAMKNIDATLPREVEEQRRQLGTGKLTLSDLRRLNGEQLRQLLGQPRDDMSHFESGDVFPDLQRVTDRRLGQASPQASGPALLVGAMHDLDVGPEDVVYDIGSGAGTTALAFSAFTRAKAVKGVELEPVYAEFSRARAQQFGLKTEILNQDATKTDFSDGTVFYCYNPFRLDSTEGLRINEAVFEKLAALGAHKRIRVTVTGPMTAMFLEAAMDGRFRYYRTSTWSKALSWWNDTPGAAVFESIPREG
jgi:16S rRNA A1518/A1519 N6-dimethyltransferase RsmA/KsgA/DIM1 with predicted DNA glycosylase/AP lyase activity